MKKITNKKFGIILYNLTMDLSGDKLKLALRHFIESLVKINRLKKAEIIIEEFIKYSKKQEGIKQIIVHSSRELEEEMLEKIRKAYGNKVEIEEKIDKNIIGGIKIQTEDIILDSSIKTQINNLKQKLAVKI